MKHAILGLILATLPLALPAAEKASSSKQGYYVGGQYAMATYTNSDVDESANPTALIGRFGRFFNEHFALEGRFGIGISDDTVLDHDVKIDNLFGIYGLGRIRLEERFFAYGLIGLSQGSGSVSGPLLDESDSDSDLSFGVGLNFAITPAVDLNVEYTQYFSKSDFDINGIGFGAVYNY